MNDQLFLTTISVVLVIFKQFFLSISRFGYNTRYSKIVKNIHFVVNRNLLCFSKICSLVTLWYLLRWQRKAALFFFNESTSVCKLSRNWERYYYPHTSFELWSKCKEVQLRIKWLWCCLDKILLIEIFYSTTETQTNKCKPLSGTFDYDTTKCTQKSSHSSFSFQNPT